MADQQLLPPSNETLINLGLERAQFRDFQFVGQIVEIYAMSPANSPATLTTGMSRVFGGYVMRQSDAAEMGMLTPDSDEPEKCLTELLGTPQIETATVVAAAGCTADGDLVVNYTDGLGTVSVTVALTTDDDTAAKIAEKIADALNAETDITDYYEVTTDGADIILTANTTPGDDAALNLDIDADNVLSTATGITNDATSANTQSGVAPTDYIAVVFGEKY